MSAAAGAPEWNLLGHHARAEQFRARIRERALSHGYIFSGPEGIGKRSFAAALAQYAENGVFSPASPRPLSDAMTISPGENGSIGIDAVREIRHFLAAHPAASPYRTLIIDNAELLTTEAENALLKITEEPFSSTLIIVIATDPEELLPTLRSRFQNVYFGTIETALIAKWLREVHGVKEKESERLAARAFGRPGLAYRIFSDASFQSLLAEAEKLLSAATPAASKAIIKTLTDDELFNLDSFLEAIMIAAFPSVVKRAPAFWHSAARLREEARRFGLNKKLQLTALVQTLQS